MKKNFFLYACLMLAMGINAQQEQRSAAHNNSSFQPGWYVGGNLGLNWFIGEGNVTFVNSKNYFSLTKNSGFIGRAEVGYDFCPIFGVRGMAGYTYHNWPDIRYNKATTSFGAEQLTVDLTVNLSNWWAGYKPNRKIDFYAFAGLGLAHRDKASFSSDYYSALVRGGLQGKLHLSPVVDLNVMAEGNFAGDKYNGDKDGFPFDIYTAFTVGITYHIPTHKIHMD